MKPLTSSVNRRDIRTQPKPPSPADPSPLIDSQRGFRELAYAVTHGSNVKPALRLAIVDDYAVVVAGVAAFLAAERIEVVEIAASLPVIPDVDIVLFDAFAQVQGERVDLEDLVRESGAKVVIYSWNLQPEMIKDAVAAGASGCLSKVLTGPEVVAALARVMAGEMVILPGAKATSVSVSGAGGWPGKSAGLSHRQAEILALITQGLTNQQIAEHVYLSINTIKSYIRSTYRKIGVRRRSQAVIWGTEHGFVPDTLLTTDPALPSRPPPPRHGPGDR